jgi:3',5'-cyclic AMP phosphodiesterase CpdA
MKFVFDSPISDKITAMKQRVRWQDPIFLSRRIDQTQLCIDAPDTDNPEFSFLVLGDSGYSTHKKNNPQRQVAQLMLEHQDAASFILHTGDVVYQVGSQEYYHPHFIVPYREFIIGKQPAHKIPFEQITFKRPFFLVPGNHDYYNLPLAYGILAQAIKPFRQLLPLPFPLDFGLRGSDDGDTYAQAFLDYTLELTPEELAHHLDLHYTAEFKSNQPDSMTAQRCLNYQPYRFTRLPNRYYSFRYGGIDFFALDSNTFNSPAPIPNTAEGIKIRQQLRNQLQDLDWQYEQLIGKFRQLYGVVPQQPELLDDYQQRLQQIRSRKQDISKRLQAEKIAIDHEQLDWFKRKLIASWLDPQARGRIVLLHHSPYTTEATQGNQLQTLEVRYHLRQVLNEVAQTLRKSTQGRPLLDLVLSGHAHCLEHLYTTDTGYADSNINWLICGASGNSVRRQYANSKVVTETRAGIKQQVAQSRLFLGCRGEGIYQKKSYSCLRIDVQQGNPPKFLVRPLIAEQAYHNWYHYQLDPFIL